MKVLKFGGTSMGSFEALQNVVKIIQENFDNSRKQIVVCSAMSGVTDYLIEISKIALSKEKDTTLEIFAKIQNKHFSTAEQFGVLPNYKKATASLFKKLEILIKGICMINEVSSRTYAYLISFGERLSTHLLAEILKSQNLEAQQYDSKFIKTKGKKYKCDEIDWEATRKATQETFTAFCETANLEKFSKEIPIVTGFFGINPEGWVSLLGRGGSDYSASVIAVSLKILHLEIWTDVDGFLSADPRIVDSTELISEIGYDEAAELCFYGAKILHPMTIRPVIDCDGIVSIRNTFNIKSKGTFIARKVAPSSKVVLSISSKPVIIFSVDIFGVHKLRHKVFAEIFALAHDEKIPIDMLTTSEVTISFCIEPEFATKNSFIKKLKLIAPIKITTDNSLLCVVSPKEVRGQVGIAKKIFEAVSSKGVNVNMYSQDVSEISQLLVIDTKNIDKTINSIHKNLIEEK